jgi:hypothetical protein
MSGARGVFFRRVGLPGGWDKRFAESVIEVVTAFEVVAAVFLGFAEEAEIDHIEDDFTDIFAAMEAPFVEERFGHGAILFESEFANAFEQFLAGDMADFVAIGFDDFLLGVIEAFADEEISFAMVPRVLFDDFVENLIEVNRVHRLGLALRAGRIGWLAGSESLDGHSGQDEQQHDQ